MTTHILQCIDCGKSYSPAEIDYVCLQCSAKQKPMQPLSGLLRCVYEYDKVANYFAREKLSSNSEYGLGRWLPILPISSVKSLPPLITNATPLRAPVQLRDELGLSKLWLKDDTVMPTASFKDRASAMVVAIAREKKRDVVATASTGNAATALAGQAASVGIQSVILAPVKAPAAKLAQILVFGARLITIKGTYDEAFELSIKACEKFGWYNRNTAYNPFTIEGKKTAALEIWEQLGYKAPDWVVVPTGDGVIASGIEKGFSDLLAMRLIDRLPRLAIVQAEGCQPIVRAFESMCVIARPEGPKQSPCNDNSEIVPELKPNTIADSISVGVPRAGKWVMKALCATNGFAVAVSDKEIISAISFLGCTTGIFAEPAAATAIAGLRKLAAQKTIKPNESVVALITGSGLKDVPAAMQAVTLPKPIKPLLDIVIKV